MTAHTLAPAQIAWKDLLKSLSNQQCVLLIGPDLLPGENLFLDLLRHLGIDPDAVPDTLPRDIAMVYPNESLFLFPPDGARARTWRKFEDFYDKHFEKLRPLYAQIARLPFPVVINTMPDLGLRRSFEQEGILHQFSYYDYCGTPEPYDRISSAPRDTRLLFNLFGVLSDNNSLVLTHDDLFAYFSKILGDKKLSSEHYIELSDTLKNATDFIFLGFKFDHWPIQMLLRLLNPKRDKALQYATGKKITDFTPSWGIDGDNPAVNVSWFDACRYANWLCQRNGRDTLYVFGEKGADMFGDITFPVTLNSKSNGAYRLPTEAEWEYAARGGGQLEESMYAGSDSLDLVGWYSENSVVNGVRRSHPVRLKRPNAGGFYDMSGNVWEWCWDWYDKYPYATIRNPYGPETGSRRVPRGGSWNNTPLLCRVSNRDLARPGHRLNYLGFRVAVSSQ